MVLHVIPRIFKKAACVKYCNLFIKSHLRQLWNSFGSKTGVIRDLAIVAARLILAFFC